VPIATAIFLLMKITCYFHERRHHIFALKFIDVYIINSAIWRNTPNFNSFFDNFVTFWYIEEMRVSCSKWLKNTRPVQYTSTSSRRVPRGRVKYLRADRCRSKANSIWRVCFSSTRHYEVLGCRVLKYSSEGGSFRLWMLNWLGMTWFDGLETFLLSF